MKLFRNIALALIILFGSIITIACTYYNNQIGPVSKDSTLKVVEIKPGNVDSIAKTLKSNHLIKNVTIFKLYVKIFKANNMKASVYQLSENMGVKKIVKTLTEGNSYNPDQVKITFKEGLHMRAIADLIAVNTNNTKDSVFALLKDETYLNELITKYSFLSNEIKNKSIYYPLEGYLFPNTYIFENKDVTVKEIFTTLLDEMGKNLAKYDTEIKASNYTIHELLTLASIVELEGVNDTDRADIAEVFYNRLRDNWSLGSDVTTYYAVKKEMIDDDLTYNEIHTYNPYNTRGPQMAGKLPVGPICNPGLESIIAAIKPKSNDYYYFLADKFKNVYFSKTETEHLQKKNELIAKDWWYTFD